MFKKIVRKIAHLFDKMYNNLQQFGPPTEQPMDSGVIGQWIKIHPQFQGPNEVYVRDMVMDGENMVVITNDGQMDMGVFSSHYVKQSEEEYDAAGNVTSTQPETITPPAAQEYVQDYEQFVPKPNIDYDVLTAGLGNPEPDIDAKDYMPKDTYVDTPTHRHPEVEQSTIKVEVKPSNFDTIYKIFSKIDTSPNIKLSFDWDGFPTKEIDMLMKYFDVSIDDIAKYIIREYFDINTIEDVVKSKVAEMVKS